MLHRRVGPHDGQEAVQPLLHGLERGGLVGLDEADDPPRVLLGEKALGNGAVQVKVQGNHAKKNNQCQPLEAQ